MSKLISGGKIIYHKLLQHKVSDAFIYSGGAIMPLVDQFYNGYINYYINTHEQSAGHAATAYAKTSGKPGVLVVTSGPGLTNCITPITDATNDSTPLIVFSGQVPLKAVGTNAFQECPSTEITKSITKWSHLVTKTEELPDVIDEAFHVAMSGKPGAVHIDLPKCVLMNKIKYTYKPIVEKYGHHNIYPSTPMIMQTMNTINQAKKPVIIAGQGCNGYPALLRLFALRANIPVTTTIHAMGVYDETLLSSLEFLGMHGNVAANYAVQNADLIIALGTRFDDRTTGEISTYAPEALQAYKEGRGGIIHVNINEHEMLNVVDSHYNFCMDCGEFLAWMIKYTVYSSRTAWTNQIKQWKDDFPFVCKTENDDEMKTQTVIQGINEYLLKNHVRDYIITSGVGNHQMMASQFIKWRYPKTFISSGSLGVMGVGLPYAIGSQIAYKNKLVIDIDGDGSFNHTLAELKTVANYKLPIKIAIMNDNCLSMVKAWEHLFFDQQFTATDLIENPDYVKLAESFGIKAMRCDNRTDLKECIAEFLEYDGAVLCDFRVKSDFCFPLVSPGSSLDDIIMHDTFCDYDSNGVEPPN